MLKGLSKDEDSCEGVADIARNLWKNLDIWKEYLEYVEGILGIFGNLWNSWKDYLKIF